MKRRLLPSHWFGAGSRGPTEPPVPEPKPGPVFAPMPAGLPRHAAEPHRALLQAACEWPDDTLVDGALLTALGAEVEARLTAVGMLAGPAPPTASDLRVRRRGLPDWWDGRRNLFLCAPDVREINFGLPMMHQPSQDQIVVAGRGSLMPQLQFAGTLGLTILGDNVVMLASTMTVGQDCTILIGQNTTATWMCGVDVRNGGAFVAGEDNMWAAGVTFYTDDTHAIRDAATGRRLNLRGGRIMIERHVWIGDGTRVMGDSHIAHDAVIGMGSVVKGRRLPANTVSVGRPARPRRSGVTWTRDDNE